MGFCEYYQLEEQPFGVTPNPRFLYRSPAHLEVLASLIYAIENDLGMSVVTAAPGLGKTTLLYYLLEKYRSSSRTALIFQTQCNGKELLRLLTTEFDEQYETDTVLVHEKLKKVLAKEARCGRRVLVVVDEAQNLSASALEGIRLLSNFETRERKLVHIILAGQQQLANKLRRPELRHLLQRFTIINRLCPLDAKQTYEYVAWRLRVAGADDTSEIFSEQALARIADGSRGIPRDINRICFNALSSGYALQRQIIGPDIVDEVVRDLDLGPTDDPSVEERHVSYQGSEIEPAQTPHKEPNWDIDCWFRPDTGASSEGPPERTPSYDRTNGVTPNVCGSTDVETVSGNDSRLAMATDVPANGFSSRREVIEGASASLRAKLGNPIKDPACDAGTLRSREASPFEVSRCVLVRKTKPSSRDWRAALAYLGIAALLAVLAGATAWMWRVTETKAVVAAAGTSEPRPSNAARASQSPVSHRSSAVSKGTGSTLATRSGLAKNNGTSSTASSVSSAVEQAPTPPYIQASYDSSAIREIVTSVSNNVQPAARNANTRAELLHVVNPKYPASARKARVEGSVVLRLTIARDGTVSRVVIVTGDVTLATAAVDAVKQWRYRPATLLGQPTEEQAEVTIYFHLDSVEPS